MGGLGLARGGSLEVVLGSFGLILGSKSGTIVVKRRKGKGSALVG